MDPTGVAAVIVSLGLGGALAAVVNALFQRGKVGADATSVVTAAARELVDPLRKELANERAAHAEEIEMERRKVAEMRTELQAAMDEARNLRVELGHVRHELDAAWTQIETHKRRIRDLEAGAG